MLLQKIQSWLVKLRLENGLYLASTGEHYRYVWIRDSFYEALWMLAYPEYHGQYKETYKALFKYFFKIENEYKKISEMIRVPNERCDYKYIHPRITKDMEEIPEKWGWIQNDIVGEFFYGLYLGESAGIKIIETEEEKNMVDMLIKYLNAIEYWKDADNGIWEEYVELHASSIGACVAGLSGLKYLGFKVPQQLIDNGLYALNDLLPRESPSKDVDMALLTLIYPFNVVTAQVARQIIANCEAKLLGENGMARYVGDAYYSENNHPMYWCMGIALLSKAHEAVGNFKEAERYAKMFAMRCVTEDGKSPEGYLGGTYKANPNTPLGWSNSLGEIVLRQYI